MDKNKDYLYIQEAKRSAVSQALYSFFYRKTLTLFLAFVLAVLCVAGTAGVFLLVDAEPKSTLDELYRMATIDAITAEADEIFPLVCLQCIPHYRNKGFFEAAGFVEDAE